MKEDKKIFQVTLTDHMKNASDTGKTSCGNSKTDHVDLLLYAMITVLAMMILASAFI